MKIDAPLVVLVAATALAAPAHSVNPRDLKDDSAPHNDDPAFISAVMRAHWYWRRLHCAQDLVWDSELAKAAQDDLNKCPHKQQHERSGSNLSAVSPAPANHDAWVEFAREATHGWHEEEILYPYDNPHYEDTWGHFTQVVWRNSSAIGCALGHCPDTGDNPVSFPGRFYCYYSFTGNNIAEGMFKQEVWGPVCSDPSQAEVSARRDIKFDWKAKQ